jgi:exoribonuclease-2
MSLSQFKEGSLVLYKNRPAVVTLISDKITIALDKKTVKRVRDKDIQLLHPGPIKSVDELKDESVSLDEAWELLDGESCSLEELAGLVAEAFTPQSAWSVWLSVSEGLLFEGDPSSIQPRSREAIAEDRQRQLEKKQQEQAEKAFLENIQNATLTEDDRRKLSEVEMLANGLTEKSRILNMLDIKQTPESAHRFLVTCGYWPEFHNPVPKRQAVELEQPDLQIGSLPEEDRLDLTGLDAYAIDDANSSDPDDAISLDGDRLWVHVADVAALVSHDSDLDREARRRASNLYLPDKVVHMLPEALTVQLGLGLQQESPALSIGFRLDEDGAFQDIQITPTRLRVTRLSYEDAENDMPGRFAGIAAICDRFREHRRQCGAASLDLPEVSVRVGEDDRVIIKPLARLESRQMVTDAMLMAGCAVAQFCREQGIAVPYTTQPQPSEVQQPKTLSDMYGYRRFFKPSQTGTTPGGHYGLGLESYSRATSPLRRYMDLIVHQQLRLYISGKTCLDEEQIGNKLAGIDEQAGLLRRTERQSNMHWKLVYLLQNPDWQGDAVIVSIEERKTVILVPELALETKIRTRENFVIDDTIRVRVTGVELPEQEVFFSVVK